MYLVTVMQPPEIHICGVQILRISFAWIWILDTDSDLLHKLLQSLILMLCS